jgi:hypothetical protein
MSSPEIFCFKCEKSYYIDIRNVRIVGPHIETTCPFCNNFTDKNVSKFAEEQIDRTLNVNYRKSSNARISKAAKMQKFFKAIESEV